MTQNETNLYFRGWRKRRGFSRAYRKRRGLPPFHIRFQQQRLFSSFRVSSAVSPNSRKHPHLRTSLIPRVSVTSSRRRLWTGEKQKPMRYTYFLIRWKRTCICRRFLFLFYCLPLDGAKTRAQWDKEPPVHACSCVCYVQSMLWSTQQGHTALRRAVDNTARSWRTLALHVLSDYPAKLHKDPLVYALMLIKAQAELHSLHVLLHRHYCSNATTCADFNLWATAAV